MNFRLGRSGQIEQQHLLCVNSRNVRQGRSIGQHGQQRKLRTSAVALRHMAAQGGFALGRDVQAVGLHQQRRCTPRPVTLQLLEIGLLQRQCQMLAQPPDPGTLPQRQQQTRRHHHQSQQPAEELHPARPRICGITGRPALQCLDLRQTPRCLAQQMLHRRKQHVQTGLHGRRREESALPPHLISLGKTGEP